MINTKPVAWRMKEEGGEFFLSDIGGGDGWEPLYDESIIHKLDKLLTASKTALEWINSQNGYPAAMSDRLYEAISEIEATR